MNEPTIKLTPTGLALYNGWTDRNYMRVWIGVHPMELDNQRLLAQHNEVHMMIGTIRNALDTGSNPGELCNGWTDAKGLAALFYFHNLLCGPCFNRLGYNHKSDLTISTKLIQIRMGGYDEIDDLYVNGHHNGLGTPLKWPPKWISLKQKIADLMDLQIRWADESKIVELRRSIERYGGYVGGQLSGSRTKVEDVPDEYEARFLEHKQKRAEKLALTTEQKPVDNFQVVTNEQKLAHRIAIINGGEFDSND